MKPIAIAFAASTLLALAACNQQEAGNNTAANAAADNAVDANAAATENGAKPADSAAPAGNDAAAPAGDKPAEGATETSAEGAEGAEGGDKPAE